jgi:outer membrane scaffolding protein for murein synthesis (MipA/OmpV family)
MRSRLPRILLIVTLGLPALATAQSFATVRLGPPGTEGGHAGLAVASTPRYLGSDQRHTRVLPLLDYQWRNGWFAGTGNGIGFNFSRDAALQVGLRLTADLGRKERRSPALRGLGDVDGRAEFGGFLNYRPTPHLLLSSALRAGSGEDRKGLVLDLGATQSVALAPALHASLGLGLTLANREHLQSHFGIRPEQAARSGYAAFTPKAGLRDLRATLGLGWKMAPSTGLHLGLSGQLLQGDAEKSPLTRDRSALSGMLAIQHRF